MKTVRHTLTCSAPDCGAHLVLEIAGRHEMRSTSQALEDIAEQAGWQKKPHLCPEHVTERRRLCSCSQRHGLKHDADCWSLKPVEVMTP